MLHHLTVNGTPGERGLQYGKAFPKLITAACNKAEQALARRNCDWMDAVIERELATLAKEYPEILDQMRGMAQGRKNSV